MTAHGVGETTPSPAGQKIYEFLFGFFDFLKSQTSLRTIFDEKKIEYNWGCNREERRYKIKDLQEVRKKARSIRKEIYISEQKSKDQLYILNMFD